MLTIIEIHDRQHSIVLRKEVKRKVNEPKNHLWNKAWENLDRKLVSMTAKGKWKMIRSNRIRS